jgi:hypothetical protein
MLCKELPNARNNDRTGCLQLLVLRPRCYPRRHVGTVAVNVDDCLQPTNQPRPACCGRLQTGPPGPCLRFASCTPAWVPRAADVEPRFSHMFEGSGLGQGGRSSPQTPFFPGPGLVPGCPAGAGGAGGADGTGARASASVACRLCCRRTPPSSSHALFEMNRPKPRRGKESVGDRTRHAEASGSPSRTSASDGSDAGYRRTTMVSARSSPWFRW